MDAKRLVRISKYLSKHLRHEPARLRLQLTPGGWVPVEDLLAACGADGFSIAREELIEVVERNDKQRLSFDPSQTRIRANQGHSTAVDLQLQTVTPPDILYHGTPAGSVEIVLRQGLSRMARHHVHLSPTIAAAEIVGRRRGRPVVLQVDAATMSREGYVFYRSENGVWLTDRVPPQYLRPI